MNEHICKYKVPPGPSPFEMSSEAKIIPQLMDNEGLGWRAALIGTTEVCVATSSARYTVNLSSIIAH